MLFNATFNNISVILQWSVLFVEETGVVTIGTERCKSNYDQTVESVGFSR